MTPRVSVVVPVHRQADHIESTVRALMSSLGELPVSSELVLVVNGADDGSWEKCSALEQSLAGVRAVRIQEAGWGRAVRTGLEAARGELICFTNSARTSPSDLKQVIELALRNPDVVIKAQRRIRDSWRRRLGSVGFNFYCRALFDLPYWDINGTPKVFARRFESLLALRADDDLLDLEFLLACRDAGYLVLEVPVMQAVRYGGRSTTGYRSAVRLFAGATSLWRRSRRPSR